MAVGSGVELCQRSNPCEVQKIAVVESKSESAEEYSSTVSIRLSSGESTKMVAGTVVGDEPR